jgi:sarcosine oxidase subunit gamma
MAIQHSPLEHLHGAMDDASAGTGGTVVLRERPLLTQLTLHACPADVADLEERLGIAPPQEPNTWAGDDPALLWLSPEEWLLVAADDAHAELLAALDGARAVAVDVSDQNAVLDLSGSGARAVLATGCALDLHPRVFGERRCAQTLLAGLAVTLVRAGDRPGFRLLVRRSAAPFLVSWLIDAMGGYRAS